MLSTTIIDSNANNDLLTSSSDPVSNPSSNNDDLSTTFSDNSTNSNISKVISQPFNTSVADKINMLSLLKKLLITLLFCRINTEFIIKISLVLW